MTCPSCGAAVPTGARSCPTCWAELPAEQIPPPPPAGGGQPPPSPPPPGYGGGPARSHQGGDTRSWSALAHLSALAAFVFPFGNILGPLVVYLVRRDIDPVVGGHARDALNFQISWTIWLLVSAVLVLVLVGILMLIVLGIAWLILVVLAAVRASQGQPVRYPWTITFVR